MIFLKRIIVITVICPVFAFAKTNLNSFATPKTLRAALNDNISSSETVVEFKKGYSSLYEIADGDAPTSGGSSVLLTSLTSDDKNMGINFMPDLSEVQEVRLNVNATSSKKVVLSFSELPFVENYQFILKDKFLNVERTLKPNSTYEFSIDKSNSSSYGKDRFSIIIKKAIDIIEEKVESPSKTSIESFKASIYPNPATTDLYVNAPDVKALDAFIYSTSGVLVQKSKMIDGNLSMDIGNLVTQAYIIVLKDSQTSNQLLVSKFLKQ